jgi:predicted DNA-binding ribbon-helix-helix protein
MRSPVVKRSIVVCGQKTSVSLEEPFWTSMKDIAAQRGTVLSDLVSEIENNRQQGNLSSAIRLFVLGHLKARADGLTGDSAPLSTAPSRYSPSLDTAS